MVIVCLPEYSIVVISFDMLILFSTAKFIVQFAMKFYRLIMHTTPHIWLLHIRSVGRSWNLSLFESGNCRMSLINLDLTRVTNQKWFFLTLS